MERWIRALPFACVLGVIGLVAAVPITWRASIDRRADALEAEVDRAVDAHLARTLELPSFGEPTRDCDAAAEVEAALARQPVDDARLADAIHCDRSWNARRRGSSIETRATTSAAGWAWRAPRPVDDPDALVEHEIVAVRLAHALSAGTSSELWAVSAAAEELRRATRGASPAASARADATLRAIADRLPAIPDVIVPRVLSGANEAIRMLRHVRASPIGLRPGSLLRPEIVRASRREELARAILGLVERARRCERSGADARVCASALVVMGIHGPWTSAREAAESLLALERTLRAACDVRS